MKPCIYMVDDEPDFQTVVHSWLEPTYETVALKDADELVGALRARTPDLVILDLHLTGSDGFEACRRVRATPGLGLVPILFLTASREFGDYRKSMSAGGSGYLTKPVGRRQLLAAVDDLLSEGRLSPRSAADVGGGD
ncbi:MAG: response regulator [Elusimicrobia bacterium]|nr:response regulator [Elusimicrobiota bacterium]